MTICAPQSETAFLPEWKFDGLAELPGVPEPSGLCYCPESDTLFIVDDGALDRPAGLYEVDLDANLLRGIELGTDLEGVCYCSLDGLLYVADETSELIFAVERENLTVVGQFNVSREFAGEVLLQAGGNGFEGIEFIPESDGGYFIVLNQDDPHLLLVVDYAEAKHAMEKGREATFSEYKALPEINLGSLHYDRENSELWVVHSWMNVMEILDVPALELKRWEVIPGSAQEAVAVDGQGRLWIGYDSGGLARYVRPETDAGESE